MSHVADVIVEAWGTTRVSCLEEAVQALVESFADVGGVRPTDRHPVTLHADSDEDLLVLLLEEVIYVVEALGRVPVRVGLDEHPDGTVAGFFDTFPAERLDATGSLPKGISRSELVFERRDARWYCRTLVDV